mgnify:CR=1 FL=1
MHRKIHPLVGLAVFTAGIFSTCGVSSAAILANYTFTGNLNSTGQTFTGTVGDLGFSGGDTGQNGLSGAGNVFFRGNGLTTSIASAITSADYFTFTITPGAGAQYQLENLKFTFGVQNDSATPFTGSVALYSSLDGFTNQIGSTATRAIAANTGVQFNAPATIDLSGLSTLVPLAPVEFRFYAAISDLSGGNVDNRIVRLDDIQLNGALIPEPSAAFLGSIGALALIRRKR